MGSSRSTSIAPLRDRHPRRDGLAVGACLDRARRRGPRWLIVREPDDLVALEASDAEERLRPDAHDVRVGAHLGDVPGLAVRRGALQAHALALTDRERVGAAVGADDGAGLVNDVARPRAKASPKETLGVAVGDEADVVGVGLVRHPEAARGRLRPHLGLGRRLPQGEHHAGEALTADDGEDVGLVLRGVGRAMEFPRPVVAHGRFARSARCTPRRNPGSSRARAAPRT